MDGIVSTGKERGPCGGSELLDEHERVAVRRCQSQGQRAGVRNGDEAREVVADVRAEEAVLESSGDVELTEVRDVRTAGEVPERSLTETRPTAPGSALETGDAAAVAGENGVDLDGLGRCGRPAAHEHK